MQRGKRDLRDGSKVETVGGELGESWLVGILDVRRCDTERSCEDAKSNAQMGSGIKW